jgi:hypothetical protein
MFSNVLRDIVDKEKNFNNRLYIEYDLASCGLNNGANGFSLFDSKNFAYIIRETPIGYLQKDQVCVPLASIFVCSPITGKPFIVENSLKTS